MTELNEIELARDYTEHFLLGIFFGETATLEYEELWGRPPEFPIIFETREKADEAKAAIGFIAIGQAKSELNHKRFGLGNDLPNEEVLAIEAGAKAGYEHRIIVKEGEK